MPTTKRNKSRRKHTRRNKSRLRSYKQSGGYSAISSGFGGSLNPYPPGGPYKVGAATNGLDGGYYYSYNQNPTLQTRILGMEDNVGFLKASGQTLAPGVKDYSTLRGGVKKRRRRNTKRRSRRHRGRMTKRKRGRSTKHRRRHIRNTKRRVRRRNKKGGSGLKSFIPSDVIDTTRQAEYGVKSLYDGLTAQRLGVNPSVMSQPISRNIH